MNDEDSKNGIDESLAELYYKCPEMIKDGHKRKLMENLILRTRRRLRSTTGIYDFSTDYGKSIRSVVMAIMAK